MKKLSKQIAVNKKSLSDKFLRAIELGLDGLYQGLDFFYDIMWGDWRRIPSESSRQTEETDAFEHYGFRQITAADFAAWSEVDDGSHRPMNISNEMLNKIAEIDKKSLLQQFNQTDLKENNQSVEFEI